MATFYMILDRKIKKKYPTFYYICQKITKLPEVYTIFAKKCPPNFT